MARIPRRLQLNMNEGYICSCVCGEHVMSWFLVPMHTLAERIYVWQPWFSGTAVCLRFSSERVNREWYLHAPIEYGV